MAEGRRTVDGVRGAARGEVLAPRIDEIALGELASVPLAELGGRDLWEGCGFGPGELEVSLAGMAFRECSFDGITASEAQLRGASLVECALDRVVIPALSAARSRWRDVVVRGSRFGSAELFDARLEAVEFVGCRLGFINLRGASVRDVRFRDCQIEELDLQGAKAERVSFDACKLSRLDVRGAELSSVDLRGARLGGIGGVGSLRGAVIGEAQLPEIASLLAEEAGLRVL